MDDDQIQTDIETSDTSSALELQPWEQANADGDAAIAEIAASFAAEDDTEEEAPVETEVAEGEVAETPAEEAPADPATERGLSRLVEREVEIRRKEDALAAKEAHFSTLESELTELRAKAESYSGDFHDRLRTSPLTALKDAGHDPDQVVRLYLAEKMKAEGKTVDPKLQAEIDRAEVHAKISRLEQKNIEYQQKMAADQFVFGITEGARTYVSKGISKDAPTVAEVAAKHPDRVHREIMDEIAKDATSRSGKEPNAPVLTYEEAVKRVEKRWTEFRALFGSAAPSAPQPDASTKPTTKPALTVENKGASIPAPKPPAKPLAARKPTTQKELEDDGIKAAIAEFKRSESARKATA